MRLVDDLRGAEREPDPEPPLLLHEPGHPVLDLSRRERRGLLDIGGHQVRPLDPVGDERFPVVLDPDRAPDRLDVEEVAFGAPGFPGPDEDRPGPALPPPGGDEGLGLVEDRDLDLEVVGDAEGVGPVFVGVLREQVLEFGGDRVAGRPALERVGGGDGMSLPPMRKGDPAGDEEPVGFEPPDDLADVTPGLLEPAGDVGLVVALLEEPDDIDLSRVQ